MIVLRFSGSGIVKSRITGVTFLSFLTSRPSNSLSAVCTCGLGITPIASNIAVVKMEIQGWYLHCNTERQWFGGECGEGQTKLRSL